MDENGIKSFEVGEVDSVSLNLLNGQVELILRSLELYGYNLEYMSTNSPEIADKIAILQFTYEQILSSQASQVNGRTEKPTLLAENLHKSNVISLTPKKKSEKENLA